MGWVLGNRRETLPRPITPPPLFPTDPQAWPSDSLPRKLTAETLLVSAPSRFPSPPPSHCWGRYTRCFCSCRWIVNVFRFTSMCLWVWAYLHTMQRVNLCHVGGRSRTCVECWIIGQFRPCWTRGLNAVSCILSIRKIKLLLRLT